MGRDYYRAMGLLGLKSSWNVEDRDACREYHAKLFRKLKRHFSSSGRGGPEHIPGFVNSLRALLEEQGYGLTDVGVMFGVTRERVRQWVEKYGISRLDNHGTMYRVWSDEENRFVPVQLETMYELVWRHVREQSREQSQQRLSERRTKRRIRQIRALRRLAECLGRTPTLIELSDELGFSRPAIAHYWGYDESPGSATRAFNLLYAAAGLTERPQLPGPRSTRLRREPNTIGARITEERLKNSLTQQALAEAVGISGQSVVKDWELNRYKPNEENLAKLAEFFGVSKEWLLRGDNV